MSTIVDLYTAFIVVLGMFMVLIVALKVGWIIFDYVTDKMGWKS